jgi:small-conductance mechanosensitive channel
MQVIIAKAASLQASKAAMIELIDRLQCLPGLHQNVGARPTPASWALLQPLDECRRGRALNRKSVCAWVLAGGFVQCSAAADTPAPGAPPERPPTAIPAPLDGPELLQWLDHTIDWYRTLGIQQESATEPRDQIVLYENRETADQVIALAFQFAKSDADLITNEAAPGVAGAGDSSSRQAVGQYQRQLAADTAAAQARLAETSLALRSASRRKRPDLQAKLAALQGELDLDAARKSLLDTMSSFSQYSGANDLSPEALKAQIDAMAATVPGATAKGTPQAATVKTGAAALPTSDGIWDLASKVFALARRVNSIAGVDQDTAELQAALQQIREPLIERLKRLSQRGDALAAQANSANSGSLADLRTQLTRLTAEFRQTAALAIPLGKEVILLKQYQHNLTTWRAAVQGEYREGLKNLGLRLGILLLFLVTVFIAAEFWRRAVLRYIQDSRRRYQLLLLRRIALWFLVVVIVGIAFASELGSIVTFAGLITAGVAVAMQSVLVSIVGYFFLIGKYGIRVGDRVQIGEVTGEVIELGLVRLYLMELGAHGQSGPTGRVVAFANSVVFQVSSGLFKQIPGVSFAWHEIKVQVPANADFGRIKTSLTAAAAHALEDYRAEILRQTDELKKTTSSRIDINAGPEVRLNFTAEGAEAVIRYPVHLHNAGEIDERVSQELFRALSGQAPAAV